MKRAWQRDLEDPRSTLSVHERARAAARRPAPEPIDLEQFIRELLDGAVGDVEVPASYPHATFDEERVEGFTSAQQPVFAQVEAQVVARVGPLNRANRERLGFAFVLEWNRRAGKAAQQQGGSRG